VPSVFVLSILALIFSVGAALADPGSADPGKAGFQPAPIEAARMAALPGSAEDSLRIARPVPQTSAEVHVSRPCSQSRAQKRKSGSTDQSSAEIRTSESAAQSSTEMGASHCAPTSRLCTAGGGMPLCSADSVEDPTKRKNHMCCDVTSEYFPITIVGPSRHFGMWLRLNLYPTLCSSVLCQRQCAVNGYESCNALGGERNLIQELIESNGDCGSGGCCETNLK
jgi:hypothetical protein